MAKKQVATVVAKDDKDTPIDRRCTAMKRFVEWFGVGWNRGDKYKACIEALCWENGHKTCVNNGHCISGLFQEHLIKSMVCEAPQHPSSLVKRGGGSCGSKVAPDMTYQYTPAMGHDYTPALYQAVVQHNQVAQAQQLTCTRLQFEAPRLPQTLNTRGEPPEAWLDQSKLQLQLHPSALPVQEGQDTGGILKTNAKGFVEGKRTLERIPNMSEVLSKLPQQPADRDLLQAQLKAFQDFYNNRVLAQKKLAPPLVSEAMYMPPELVDVLMRCSIQSGRSIAGLAMACRAYRDLAKEMYPDFSSCLRALFYMLPVPTKNKHSYAMSFRLLHEKTLYRYFVMVYCIKKDSVNRPCVDVTRWVSRDPTDFRKHNEHTGSSFWRAASYISNDIKRLTKDKTPNFAWECDFCVSYNALSKLPRRAVEILFGEEGATAMDLNASGVKGVIESRPQRKNTGNQLTIREYPYNRKPEFQFLMDQVRKLMENVDDETMFARAVATGTDDAALHAQAAALTAAAAELVTPPSAGGSTSLHLLGRVRRIVKKGRAQYAMYKGELTRVSQLRRLEKQKAAKKH